MSARLVTGKPILIVDDEPAVRQSVERILQRRGLETVTARDDDDAIRQLDARDFDLVLCDVHLGNRSGIDLYRAAIRRRPSLDGRFVFMTGDVLSLEVREFFSASRSRHLAKPFEVAELLEAVGQAAA